MELGPSLKVVQATDADHGRSGLIGHMHNVGCRHVTQATISRDERQTAGDGEFDIERVGESHLVTAAPRARQEFVHGMPRDRRGHQRSQLGKRRRGAATGGRSRLIDPHCSTRGRVRVRFDHVSRMAQAGSQDAREAAA